jgi:O-antigen/teichoic acid export membrane protein
VAILTTTTPLAAAAPARSEARRAARDGLIVAVGGQVERALGIFTSLLLRWGLEPALLGVYAGLRLYLDNTNRSSLGIGLGAVQEIPILRAAGRHDEARRVADVAHTASTLTCLVYAVGLLLWALVRRPLLAGDPLGSEWTWGLVAIAGLTLLQRHMSFLIALLRAHQEFGIATELDVIEAAASAILFGAGLWLAGFWGLIAAVGLVLGLKTIYLHSRYAFSFRCALDGPIVCRLLRVGLPILANTALYGTVVNLDRVLILWRIPDGERALGLYSVALLGTSWGLDLAGRLVTVLYPYFQTTLGRTGDAGEVVRRAARATEAQAPVLAAIGAVAFVIGPAIIEVLLPRYRAGLPALRPLLLGTLCLGMAWPARQMLIAIGRPLRLAVATVFGLGVTAVAGVAGADAAGIVGVAWGMTLGFVALAIATSAAAVVPVLGTRLWLAHTRRLVAALGWPWAGALLASYLPVESGSSGCDEVVRGLVLAAWLGSAFALTWRRRRGRC